jgi:hypothetical protein
VFVSQSVDGVNELVILDAGDMPHDALAVGGPHVDAEPEMFALLPSLPVL